MRRLGGVKPTLRGLLQLHLPATTDMPRQTASRCPGLRAPPSLSHPPSLDSRPSTKEKQKHPVCPQAWACVQRRWFCLASGLPDRSNYRRGERRLETLWPRDTRSASVCLRTKKGDTLNKLRWPGVESIYSSADRSTISSPEYRQFNPSAGKPAEEKLLSNVGALDRIESRHFEPIETLWPEVRLCVRFSQSFRALANTRCSYIAGILTLFRLEENPVYPVDNL